MKTTIPASLVRLGGMILTIALSTGTAMAQPADSRPRGTAAGPAVNTANLNRDLVAVYAPATWAEHNSYNDENPCVFHTDVIRVGTVKLGRLGSTPLPSGTKATLFREGQVFATWNVVTQTGPTNQPIVLGSFTWTRPHPCPVPGEASVTPAPPSYAYRLVVDPNNQVGEGSERNNSVEFRIIQIATFTKVP